VKKVKIHLIYVAYIGSSICSEIPMPEDQISGRFFKHPKNYIKTSPHELHFMLLYYVRGSGGFSPRGEKNLKFDLLNGLILVALTHKHLMISNFNKSSYHGADSSILGVCSDILELAPISWT